MLEKADKLELAESQMERLIEVCHRNGLSYRDILRLWEDLLKGLKIQTKAEEEIDG